MSDGIITNVHVRRYYYQCRYQTVLLPMSMADGIITDVHGRQYYYQCPWQTVLLPMSMADGIITITTRQSEMADLARRATSVCTKFHRDRLRND